MPLALTVDQVASLAPDPASLAAGKKLAGGRNWSRLGQDERALWGECQGSALYQVRVDLADLAARCSCPSRKFPCKHALGLLLLVVASPGAAPAAAAPDWVVEWLGKRAASAEKKEKRAEDAAARPVDEKEQARRAQKRRERVAEGLSTLELWMSDLVRNGLAAMADQGPGLWEKQAARLVDAQVPALAARLRRLATVPRTAPDWPRRVLSELGRIALLIEAFRRLDALEPRLQEDVRGLLGWTLREEEVLARGEALDDRWWLVGQRTDEDERLRVQRNWLQGERSGRHALVLQFAVGTATFTDSLVPGTGFEGRLRFWPSAFPCRALIEERRGAPEPWRRAVHGFADVEALLVHAATALARQPWLDQVPCVLEEVRPARDAAGWSLVDRAGRGLPLASREPWKLVALSGGQPLTVAAEWDGEALLPLAALGESGFERLGGGA